MSDITINSFRKRRGRMLKEKIAKLSADLGRDIRILDVGGRPDYWMNVNASGISKVVLMNNDETELKRLNLDNPMFEPILGDACDLSEHGDNAFDMVHSNSVIEHVGDWDKMAAMAAESLRVGQAGWVQTPAYEFPIEPHFRLPFIHWLGTPTRASLLTLSPLYKGTTRMERRGHVERINLLSRREMDLLFPGTDIWTERVLFAKSYVAKW